MAIRAKFWCNEVGRVNNGSGEAQSVKLVAVSGKENEPWSKWTPSGGLNLYITNPDAFGQFEPGKTYFLDVTLAE